MCPWDSTKVFHDHLIRLDLALNLANWKFAMSFTVTNGSQHLGILAVKKKHYLSIRLSETTGKKRKCHTTLSGLKQKQQM